MLIYKLSVCGFESRCCHNCLNVRYLPFIRIWDSGSKQLLYSCSFNVLVFLGFTYTGHIAFLYFQLYIIFIISYKLLLLIIIITIFIIMVIINIFIISVIIVLITIHVGSSVIIFVVHSFFIIINVTFNINILL